MTPISTWSDRDQHLAGLDQALQRVGEVVDDEQAQRRLAVVGAEAGGGVGDLGAGEPSHDPAAESLQGFLLAREVLDLVDLAIADDHVGLAGEDRRQQLRDVGAAVLVVGVGVDDDVGAELEAGVEPRLEAGRQALVVGQADDVLDAVLAGDLDRAVGRAVVDDQQLDRVDARRSAAGCRRSSRGGWTPRSGRGFGRSASLGARVRVSAGSARGSCHGEGACGRARRPFSAPSPRHPREERHRLPAQALYDWLIDQSISGMNAQLTGTDRSHLARALELAEGGRGRVSPNPLVGAVVVRGGEVIGEGFHAELGGLHAERAALADCERRGEDPAGATMYVTLEPCAHTGRQPPCTEAILEAGIARVVIASDDPSEKAAGRGPGILRDGGVEVELAAGEEATAARLLNQPFRKHARTGLPLVTLKLAMSLDGRTSAPPGDSPWISGERSRELVHRWRAESDAIAVGIDTVLTDDPLLTARPEPSGAPYAPQASIKRTGTSSRQPVRVVFDRQARLPLDSQLLRTLDDSPVLVVVSPEADASALREAGAEILVADGIEAALADLGRRGITSLFLEGGPTLASAFQIADQLDEARTFVAPVLLGSDWRTGPVAAAGGSAGGGGASVLGPPASAPPARETALSSTVKAVGMDALITARFREW